MCGLAGIWHDESRARNATDLASAAKDMANAIRHRGPNDQGIFVESNSAFALSHRRLSILDLSSEGAQPMRSASTRYVIVYNGEIYNHLDLREELEGAGQAPSWRGHSDTETLLAAIEAWSLPGALAKSYGMFALALWDRRERKLWLARDRFGEKPLYFGHANGTLLFGSELAALCAHPAFEHAVCPEAVDAFLGLSYIPAPRSIYAAYRKLEPGTLVSFDAADADPVIEQWYDFDAVIDQTEGARHGSTDYESALDTLHHTLLDVVSQHMLSDVPLGAFLSGGIDSSLITAMMEVISPGAVRTFSVGFENADFSEAPFAAAVARHLGTSHTEFSITAQDAIDSVERLVTTWDEPFADSSALPTLLLCQKARQEVSVALTGDGGDEIFGGYNRHIIGPKLWHRVSKVPYPIRRTGMAALGALGRTVGRLPSGRLAMTALGLPHTTPEKLAQFTRSFGNARSYEEVYQALTATARIPEAGEAITLTGHGNLLDEREMTMRWDTLHYLPGDILAKVDRAAMSTSLETRAPLIDGRVVDAAWSMSIDWKIGESLGKRPLRDLLALYVDPSLFERPKQGFAIPLSEWLRGPLREWAEGAVPVFRETPELRRFASWVSETVDAHMSGRATRATAVFNAAILAGWFARQTKVKRAAR